MASKTKDSQKAAPVTSVSLRRVLKQSKRIKETVRQAASELASVNEILTQENKVNLPAQTIQDAIAQNEAVEQKMAQAADDLNQVNAALAREMAERVVLESELAGMKVSLAEVSDDLSKSQVKEREAQKSALLDALTGLPNRASFEERLNHGLAQAKRHGWGLAVLFIDIDKFKNVNDSYGHDLGDRVLLMIANRLQASIRKQDTVSRWGGDEFVCLLLEAREKEDVARLAKEMVDQLAEDCEINEVVFSVRASIGIAMYPADGDTADILFKNADTAMYQAKEAGKGVALFSAG